MEDDAFIGIDPSDTLTVNYGKGEFTLGVLPAGMWDRVNTKMIITLTGARRRGIRDLSARGEDPEGLLGPASKLTNLDIAVQSDETLKREVNSIRVQAIKYGLRGHDKFKTKKGVVPYHSTNEEVDGMTARIVAESTLDYYRMNPALMEALWVGLRQLHDLSEPEKKA